MGNFVTSWFSIDGAHTSFSRASMTVRSDGIRSSRGGGLPMRAKNLRRLFGGFPRGGGRAPLRAARGRCPAGHPRRQRPLGAFLGLDFGLQPTLAGAADNAIILFPRFELVFDDLPPAAGMAGKARPQPGIAQNA